MAQYESRNIRNSVKMNKYKIHFVVDYNDSAQKISSVSGKMICIVLVDFFIMTHLQSLVLLRK